MINGLLNIQLFKLSLFSFLVTAFLSSLPLSGYTQFGTPTALTSSSTTETIQNIFPSLSTDQSGTWVSVWTAATTSETLDIANLDAYSLLTDTPSFIETGDIITRHSTDNGKNWSQPITLSLNHSTTMTKSFLPHIATNGNGNWLAVWNSDDPLNNTIGTDQDILYSNSTNGGTNWSAPIALNTNAATDTNMDLMPQTAADANGNWLAVWSSRRTAGYILDNDIMISRSANDGAVWSPSQYLRVEMNLDVGNDIWPQIVTDGLGHWVVVWESISMNLEQNITMTIKSSRSSNNGATWSIPLQINRLTMPQDAMEMPQLPRLATDRNGNWIIVWSQDWRIYASRSINNGAAWSSPTRVDQDPIPLEMDFYNFLPQAAADGLGNWIISWNAADVFAYLGGNLDLDIRMSRSFDRGATWLEPSILNQDNSSDLRIDTWPQLAADSAGNWVAMWQGTEGPTSATMATNILSAKAKLEIPPTPTPTPTITPTPTSTPTPTRTPLSGRTSVREWIHY